MNQNSYKVKYKVKPLLQKRILKYILREYIIESNYNLLELNEDNKRKIRK